MSELEKLNALYKEKFDKLQAEYKQDVDNIQKHCKHKEITPWLIELDEHGMPSTVCVKGCKICGKKLVRKDYRLIPASQLPYEFQPGPVKRVANQLVEEGKAENVAEGTKIYYEELK